MQEFKNEVEVVTGARRGIGLRLVRHFATQGTRVASGARRKDEIAHIERELRSAVHQVVALPCNEGKPSNCEYLEQTAVEQFGWIDALVNNASISGVKKPSWGGTSDELDEVMRVNVHGPLNCIRQSAPSVISKRSGSIVNIGSFTGKRTAHNRAVSAKSKIALNGLTTAALKLAQHNVHWPRPYGGWTRVEEVFVRAAQAQNISPEAIRDSFKL